MMLEIVAAVLTTSGWVLVTSTLPTEYWKVYSLAGTVILTTPAYFSNLWKLCITDSTGVSNCKDFPSLLALDGYIQACRGLMISAVCLGFVGTMFALIGMECTKIGGSQRVKARIACLAGVTFILSGLCALTSCSIYAHQITTEFFDPLFVEQKYELGAALFIGWGGAILCIVGGSILCFSITSCCKAKASVASKGFASHSRSSSRPTIPAESLDKRVPSQYSNLSSFNHKKKITKI